MSNVYHMPDIIPRVSGGFFGIVSVRVCRKWNTVNQQMNAEVSYSTVGHKNGLYDVRKVSFVPWVVTIGRLGCGACRRHRTGAAIHLQYKSTQRKNELTLAAYMRLKTGLAGIKMQRIAYSIP